MKYMCLVFLIILATVLADEGRNAWLRDSAECQIETKVKDTTLAKAILKTSFDDPKLQDYSICMMKKMGTMDENGELKRETIKNILDNKLGQDKANEMMEECVVKKDTPGETAVEMIKCSKKYIKDEED